MVTHFQSYATMILIALFTLCVCESVAQDRPIIAIDPGHGGSDAGVEIEGWLEKDLILELSMVMGAEFVKAGYDVIYTRTGDYSVSWDDRRLLAEKAGASMLFMLHANRDEDLGRHGAEIYLNLENDKSRTLTDRLAEALTDAGSDVVVEGKEWPFLRSTTVPTAMVEVAFMTHPVERRLLKSTSFHHELGRTFVAAADAFLKGE